MPVASAFAWTSGGVVAFARDPDAGKSFSHETEFANVAVQLMLPAPVFSTAKVWLGTMLPPSIPVKVNPVWLSKIVAAAGVTSRLTVIGTLFPVVVLETVTIPE